jgi:hypothetical protein
MKKRVGDRAKLKAPRDLRAGESIEHENSRWRVTASASEGADIRVAFVEALPQKAEPKPEPKQEKKS